MLSKSIIRHVTEAEMTSTGNMLCRAKIVSEELQPPRKDKVMLAKDFWIWFIPVAQEEMQTFLSHHSLCLINHLLPDYNQAWHIILFKNGNKGQVRWLSK